MCISPCATCFAENFYSCLTCQSADQILEGSLCLYSSTIYYHITTTALAIIFIVPILIRKRCLVLIKILDLIQLASYFKLIRGYAPNRNIWLYLNMRGWGTFDEGWKFISEDPTVPIWTNQEGVVDKAIRIASIWVFFALLIIIIGILKVVLNEKNLTFGKFMQMNLANTISFTIYFTLQDLAFISTTVLLNIRFNTVYEIIGFSIGIVCALGILFFIVWSFYRINFRDETEKYYFYKYFFLFGCDYDLFPTYQLLTMPQQSKQIKRYSNLRVIDMIKKVGYSFLIVAYLSDSQYDNYNYLDEVYQIFAYILFFEIIWFFIVPFSLKQQFLQFIIFILATIICFYLLFAPWYLNSQLIHTIMVLILFGLALISLILQCCLNIYNLIPADIYDIGLKIVIQDPRLLKQIAMRRKQQQQIQKKLKSYQEQNEKMKNQISKNKTKDKQLTEIQSIKQNKLNKSKQSREDSEISLGRQEQKPNQYEAVKIDPEADIQRDSMNSQQIAQLYKVDELKRRRVYQWNKQKPFSYSNKIQ